MNTCGSHSSKIADCDSSGRAPALSVPPPELDLLRLQQRLDLAIDDINQKTQLNIVLGFPTGSVVYLQTRGCTPIACIDDIDCILFADRARSAVDERAVERDLRSWLTKAEAMPPSLAIHLRVYESEEAYRNFIEMTVQNSVQRLPGRNYYADGHWQPVNELGHKKKFAKNFVETLLLTTGESKAYMRYKDALTRAVTTAPDAVEGLYEMILASAELRQFATAPFRLRYGGYRQILLDIGCPPRQRR